VEKHDHREYGFAEVQISRFGESGNIVDALFEGLGDEMQVRVFISSCEPMYEYAKVWMSHGDQLSVMPPDFHVIGRTNTAPYAAIAHNSKSFYGIQFHPEVTHSPKGRQLISRFVLNICQCRQNWTMVR